MTFATDQQPPANVLSATSVSLLRLRDAVFERWIKAVQAQVPQARDVAEPVLVNTLPLLFDNLAEALTPEYPRDTATSHTNLGAAHGGERARMTAYGSDQVIHEYHLFRDVILDVCHANDVHLTLSERAAIDQSINTAVRESVRAFGDKQEELRHRMAAALSHDMRTPLSVIHTGAHLVSISNDLERSRQIGSKIAANSIRLIEMVDQLIDALTFYQGATLPLALSEFDMHSLAQEVCDALNTEGDRIVLTGTSVVGHWCRNSVRRAIENLSNNALKYGDGTRVTLQVDSCLGRVMVTVHNSGEPIPVEQRQRIFQYLRREQNATRDGWGIGLPFVQTVAESHGGSVAVDSAAETGTTFVIDLPVDCRMLASQAGARAQTPAAPAALEPVATP